MAGTNRKRPNDAAAKAVVSKKRRLQMAAAYNSSSSEDENEDVEDAVRAEGDDAESAVDQKEATDDAHDLLADFAPIDLADSDNDSDDVHNAAADDGMPSDDSAGDDSGDEATAQSILKRRLAPKKGERAKTTDKRKSGPQLGKNADGSDEEDDEDDVDQEDEDLDDNDDDDDDEEDDFSDADSNSSDNPKSKSKRNDPTAFATSLSKILSTKLSTSRRADPVLARSVAAAEAARALTDSTLEVRARRQIREHKRLALEKGRVRDVVVGGVATGKPASKTGGGADGEEMPEGGASGVQATERRLRKTAQRGVVRLFNAVRAAQVASADAEKSNRRNGVLGMGKREARVQEMSRKGFLDLIAGGGK